MRTDSTGGSEPNSMKRRAFAYDARPVSIAKVEIGSSDARWNAPSSTRA